MDKNEFTNRFGLVRMDEVDSLLSPYGNEFYTLTCENLKHLMNGGVICDIDEYGTFIRLNEDAAAMLRNEIGG